MTRETGRRRVLPTTDELRVWRGFIETAEALRSELGSRLQSECNLSPGDYAVLLALTEADGQRLRSSRLADDIGWERSRLSHHLGRMERRGLVRRENCTTDNRGAEIVLTPGGATAFRSATVPHLRAVRELFIDALTPEQVSAAGEIAAALRARLDVAAASPPRAASNGSGAQALAAGENFAGGRARPPTWRGTGRRRCRPPGCLRFPRRRTRAG